MPPSIVTIGHSNHPWDRFLALLIQHEVEALVDIRAKKRWQEPFSALESIKKAPDTLSPASSPPLGSRAAQVFVLLAGVDRLRQLAATTRRTEAEEQTAGVAHPARPAQRGAGLALAGIISGITHIHGEIAEKGQTAPQGAQRRVMGQQLIPKIHQVVSLFNGETKFFH